MDLSLSAASALAFAIAIPLIIGLLLGWFLWGRRLTQISDELQSEIERRATSEGQMARVPELQQELARREERNLELTEKLMQAEAQKQSGEEKLKLLFEAKETLSEQFRNLANQIFEEKGAKFAQQNAASLETLLKPLSDKLKDFQGRVEETYDKESKQRFSLQSEIQKLVELNTRMSTDAVNLTNALKGDSKTQGSWGELVLERVLEASGLQKGREYEVQVSMQGEDGKKWQPDVVVKLPEGKHVVIDSKVSLTAYEAYCSGADETVRKTELARHVESIRRHVEELGRKNYQGLYGIRTLDFVLMFVPVEPAFILAAREKQELFIEAIKRNVMIVSPTTLLISLRTIASVWRYEYQNRNAQELVRQCTALYEKFVNFVADLEEVGKKIDAAHKSYEDAHAKLKSGRGNLIRQTERIRELGLKPSKTLPPHLSEAALEEDSEAEIRPLPGIGRSG
jgi:DNA recombination protein RmuC